MEAISANSNLSIGSCSKASAAIRPMPMRWQLVGLFPHAAHPSQFTTSHFYNVYTELRCILAPRESSSFVPWAVAPGAFLFAFARSPSRIHTCMLYSTGSAYVGPCRSIQSLRLGNSGDFGRTDQYD